MNRNKILGIICIILSGSYMAALFAATFIGGVYEERWFQVREETGVPGWLGVSCAFALFMVGNLAWNVGVEEDLKKGN